jgi:toxin ParE1/3/4
MGLKVIYLEVAIWDLQSIYKYIAQDSKKYAGLEVNKIKLFIDSLKSFPFKGKYYETIKGQEIRSIVFRNYIIFHTVSKEQVRILSIHHHARLISNNPAFNEEE